MKDSRSDYLKLPLPDEANYLEEDLPRIKESFKTLDYKAREIDERDYTLKSYLPTLEERLKKEYEGLILEEKKARKAGDASLSYQLVQDILRLERLIESISFPIAGPGQSGLVPAGGKAGQVYQVSKDGKTYIWSEFINKFPSEVFPYAGQMDETGKHPVNRLTGEVDYSCALCDGETYMAPDGVKIKTPDLRDQFIIGAGRNYNVGDVGGSKEHDHAVTVYNHTLSIAQMPSHTHKSSFSSGGSKEGFGNHANVTGKVLYTTSSTGGSQAHTHGAGSANSSHLPPYYALCLIMKL